METSTLVCQAVSQAVHGSAPYEPPSLPDGPVLNPLRKYTMKKPTKEQVIHRAYELWEQAGKPEGRGDESRDANRCAIGFFDTELLRREAICKSRHSRFK